MKNLLQLFKSRLEKLKKNFGLFICFLDVVTHCIGITNTTVCWPEISAMARCLALASNDQFIYRVTDAV